MAARGIDLYYGELPPLRRWNVGQQARPRQGRRHEARDLSPPVCSSSPRSDKLRHVVQHARRRLYLQATTACGT